MICIYLTFDNGHYVTLKALQPQSFQYHFDCHGSVAVPVRLPGPGEDAPNILTAAAPSGLTFRRHTPDGFGHEAAKPRRIPATHGRNPTSRRAAPTDPHPSESPV